MKLLLSTAVMILLVAIGASAQCPTLNVSGPAGVTEPGTSMEFRGVVDAVGLKLHYSWSVSAGFIVEGQGTPQIKVSTDRTMSGVNVTATLEISDSSRGCKAQSSDTSPVAQMMEWESVDEWGNLKDNDQRGRLDAFFAELANNPHHTGLIFLRITERERWGVKNGRVQLILDHTRFRQFDRARIWFCLERGEESRTVVYRFPPERVDFPYKECTMIKGGDLK